MNNSAALGYAIMAAKAMGWDESVIKVLEHEMGRKMDFHTEEEAETEYREF